MENKSAEIKSLLDSRRVISHELGRLVYGSPEVREVNGEKYLYLHFRDGGLQRSNYLGKYNEDTHNLILNNNEKAKGLKSELRALDKKLKSLGYQPETLKDPVALNIDFARRHISDTIYAQASLEGVATTYAETKDIIEGAQVSGLSPDDIMKIVNLKHAWDFVLDQDVVMSGSDLSLLCQINKLIEEGFYYTAGKLRGVPVKIGGTTWSPELPVESRVKEDLASILLRHDSVLDRAIALLLFIMRSQLFIDGNKRTAVIFANHYLVSHAEGLIIIPAEHVPEFKSLLVDFYEQNDSAKISVFLRDKCFLSL